jgi:hypothetical protein
MKSVPLSSTGCKLDSRMNIEPHLEERSEPPYP